MIMNKQTIFAIAIAALLVGGVFFLGRSPEQPEQSGSFANTALAAKFEELSQNGNSSCSGTFKDSIAAMPDSARLQGSCCSPMSIHRYSEQVEGLQNFKSVPSQNIAEIPDDPYDISAELAKQLISYYDIGAYAGRTSGVRLRHVQLKRERSVLLQVLALVCIRRLGKVSYSKPRLHRRSDYRTMESLRRVRRG